MRPRVPLTSHLLLTNQCHSQVCSSYRICMSVHFCTFILYFRVFIIIIIIFCREKPEGSTGKLGGESQLQENSEIARDF